MRLQPSNKADAAIINIMSDGAHAQSNRLIS